MTRRLLCSGVMTLAWGLGAVAVGCDDDGETQPTTSTSSGGGTGGSTGGAGGSGAEGGGGAGGPIVTNPDNILNNGDFETGLMCWGNWVWSTTGLDYQGDYDFALSSDAHSGDYSLEIFCYGSDCDKAAINTGHIYSPPDQAYALSLWAKCPAGKEAAVYIPETATGELFEFLTCSGDWAENVYTFDAGSTGTVRIYVYNRDDDYLRLDDIVLTYGDGTVPQQTVYHSGTRDVGLTDGALTVDGAPYLALGFFNVPHDDLEQAATLGANTVTGLGTETHPDCFNTEQQSYLDHAYDLGVNVVPDSTYSARLDEPAVFEPILQRFGPHRANIAWLLVDEPDQQDVAWYYITGPTLVAEYDVAKANSNLPIMADLQRASWSTADEVSPYADAMDVWMAEPYGNNFGSVEHAIDLFDSIDPKPVWLAQNAIDVGLIVAKAYWTVIQGSTGIIYFTWGSFSADGATLAAAGDAFSELSSLQEVIFATSVDDQVTAPSGVSFIAREHQGATYILAVNPTAQSVQGAFTVQGLAADAEVTVQFESRTITATAGQFTDNFDGVARHVYVIQ